MVKQKSELDNMQESEDFCCLVGCGLFGAFLILIIGLAIACDSPVIIGRICQFEIFRVICP